MRLRDGSNEEQQEGRMIAGGQKEKCVTNVETAPENNTVGVNGEGSGVKSYAHYKPPVPPHC